MEEVNKFCELLMFLYPPWEVTSVVCREGGEDRKPGRVTIEMAYRAESLVPCPECGSLCKRHDTKAREWQDLDLMGWRTVLRAEVPRANCPTHGVHQVAVPWEAAAAPARKEGKNGALRRPGLSAHRGLPTLP